MHEAIDGESLWVIIPPSAVSAQRSGPGLRKCGIRIGAILISAPLPAEHNPHSHQSLPPLRCASARFTVPPMPKISRRRKALTTFGGTNARSATICSRVQNDNWVPSEVIPDNRQTAGREVVSDLLRGPVCGVHRFRCFASASPMARPSIMPETLEKLKSAGCGGGSWFRNSPDRVRTSAISCANSCRFVVISEAYLFPSRFGGSEMTVARQGGQIGCQGVAFAGGYQ